MDPILELVGVGKRYTQYRNRRHLILEHLGLRRPRPTEQKWAIRGVDLAVKPGEFVSIIGRNGAGKSTLLQIAAGVLAPSEGEVRRRGRVHALLELASNLDPEATGRENVRTQAALMGVPKREWPRLIDDVARFAEIGPAFDHPVKTYSSGMFVRVAFACHASMSPDLLIIDEALAVGDIFFQQRCHERIRELRSKGTAILFVSHNLGDVRRYSDRVLLVEDGAVVFEGDAAIAAQHYMRRASVGDTVDPTPSSSVPQRSTAIAAHEAQVQDGVVLEGLDLLDRQGGPTRSLVQGAPLTIMARFRVTRRFACAVAGFEIRDAHGVVVHGNTTLTYSGTPPMEVAPGRHIEFRHTVEMALGPGPYTVEAALADVPADVFRAHRRMSWTEFSSHASMRFRAKGLGPVWVTAPIEDGHPVMRFQGVVDLPASGSLVVVDVE